MSQPNLTPPPPSSILDPIWSHIKNYHWLLLALIGLGTCPTLLQFWANVGPPWPPAITASTLSTIALMAMMLWTHGLWQGESQKKLKRLVNIFFVLTVLSFAGYTLLQALYVVKAPDADNLEAIGIHLRKEWAEILEKGVLPDGTALQEKSEHYLLKANAWNPYAIYPKDEVNLIRWALLCGWIVGFGSVGALTSVFILLQEKKAASKRPAKDASAH